MTPERNVRPLTHDEKKAAEAAFEEAPFNPAWSDTARKIYEGILEAMARRDIAQRNRALAEARAEKELETVSL